MCKLYTCIVCCIPSLHIEKVGGDIIKLGFLRHPLPEKATVRQCGFHDDGIGGDFTLWNGSLWKGTEFKPAGTNTRCTQVGQTAAIRVNMRTREARLFVDDEEQPGIFTDIPSPLCLGISTGFRAANQSIDILWLKRLRVNQELQQTENDIRIHEQEKSALNSQINEMKLQLADLPIWVGTKALRPFDRTAHSLTPTTLTQIIITPEDNPWRTAFTHLIENFVWEFRIKISQTTFSNAMLGFLRYPLPDDARQRNCGSYFGGIGGDFNLETGGMWKEGKEFKPDGTNKRCDRIGQTAAIRVNMMTRVAILIVDDEKQPGFFADIPSPLCLAISTHDQDQFVEVLWLKRL
ncbi:hypothetical protein BLNAU_17188 [Blattamonas nauphoetae]|uniref:Uncharacterized protein n=1 Tax=Blattamonas nauphoetae TaxID=2049346 RepID=A0ABQ9X7T8_9EUKA|nr:hypothetical protein BLNAU_17188 [Blattamonas nauphoetae]